MSDYDADILLWSEHQADLLRRMAAGERVNDQVDWANVAEEIEAVGRTERRACESHLVQALLHDLKAEAWPLSREVPHWRAEARAHRGEARAAFSPGMRQRLDVATLYREARRRMPETIDGDPPLPVPEVCPVTLDELLGGEAD
jgi:hypothetical protein